ncbi:MAG: hypothetical protein IBJ12_12250 [Sphingomonadaceae bacterium]|nr:hypothetical protein [Sphingomonadaceae bacterium]
MRMFLLVSLAFFSILLSPSARTAADGWVAVSSDAYLQLEDDDLRRNQGVSGFLDGIAVSQLRFSENGFDWHLIRFTNPAKPDGPLWMVPHDDENAAFDAMIAAVKEYGGVGIAVNSGPGSLRRQAGYGPCGVRLAKSSSCDPNRNFDHHTPLFTSAFLSQRVPGQPVIALHTNTHGFSGDGQGGRGEITIVDRDAYRRGEIKPRDGGLFAIQPRPEMANYDTLGLTAYLASEGKPPKDAEKCGRAIADAGVHFWHERVIQSDGSMSNYLVLNQPDIPYFNAESRDDIDLALSASRHAIMVKAYIERCMSGNQPAS